jgi:hypothetical protein
VEPSEFLAYCIRVLESLGIRYFVTGSIATVFYGEPRFTNDVDIVIDLRPQQVSALCRGFPNREFYVSEEAVNQAIEHRTQFNVIHPASGLKADFMVPADTPFNRARFRRARRVRPSPDYEAVFAAPEDVILKKLEYYREGGSEKHLRDIVGILKSGEAVDRAYLTEWAAKLDLQGIWEAVERRSTGPDSTHAAGGAPSS